MNVDEREWDDQESALESLRSGNSIANEARINQYKILFAALAKPTDTSFVPGLRVPCSTLSVLTE